MIKQITDTYSGVITINYENNTVIKKFSPSVINEGLMGREVFWLKHLEKFDRTPQIIEVTDDSIVMTYVGERISKESVPDDWKTQVLYISEGLKKYKCSHNDIKPEDIQVKDGIIYIVDFGWSTRIGEPIPSHWSTGIGDDFKYGIHDFNDLYSLTKSIEFVLSNKDV